MCILQVVAYVDGWLDRHQHEIIDHAYVHTSASGVRPHIYRWQYDDNAGERSFEIFHVHVFIETRPGSCTVSPAAEYLPPHARHIHCRDGREYDE
jgi:hypothetical protein